MAPIPPPLTAADESELRQRYAAAGQAHVFAHYDALADNESERHALWQQLRGLPVETLATLYAAAMAPDAAASPIAPYTGPMARSIDLDDAQRDEYWQRGLEAIRQGHVAALVLAGGQGTRLGYAGPKGLYDMGLPSGKSLFQLFAERILKLNQLATNAPTPSEIVLPFYIMTSPLNHDETVAYFAKMDYFGLGAANVFFFPQGMLPCLTNDGSAQMILETSSAVAMAPDGNGGLYPALQSSGALRDMRQRGIASLHVFSIDNALAQPADPLFLGYCLSEQADCGNQVVAKQHAHEAVGVMAARGAGNRACIVEYSELTEEQATATDPVSGQLLFGAGNICNHYFSVDFIEQTVLTNMNHLYHVAHKKIPYYDPVTKTTVVPTKPNGIKLETFIFDVFPLAERLVVWEVSRAEAFAPIKNAPGAGVADTPESAGALLSQRAQQWVLRAGGTLANANVGDAGWCEIAPSTSYAGEGLEDLVKDKVLECPFRL